MFRFAQRENLSVYGCKLISLYTICRLRLLATEVYMKKILATALLTTSMATTAGTLTFSWTEPTENVDGSPISAPASYEIRYGSGTENQVVSAVGTSHSVEVGDSPAVYYAQIRTVVGTTYSEWSEIVTTVAAHPTPKPPTMTIMFSCDGCNLISN